MKTMKVNGKQFKSLVESLIKEEKGTDLSVVVDLCSRAANMVHSLQSALSHGPNDELRAAAQWAQEIANDLDALNEKIQRSVKR